MTSKSAQPDNSFFKFKSAQLSKGCSFQRNQSFRNTMALETSDIRTGASIKKMLSFFSCCGSSQNGWVVEPSRFEPPASPPQSVDDHSNESDKANSESVHNESGTLSKSEDLDEKHQLYCPICMYFFEDIYKTRCCFHHICKECHIGMVQRKRKESGRIKFLHRRSIQVVDFHLGCQETRPVRRFVHTAMLQSLKLSS